MKRDTGSASVLVLGVGSLLAVVSLTIGLIAVGLAAHRQAVRAADLAALAGAQRSLTDAGEACQIARAVAMANGAELGECALESRTLRVEVRVSPSDLLPVIAASARAGVRLS